ncbi:MAG: hypothetical protein NVS1B4_01620 [Gemmatimonadaceae bacterium]
MSNAQSSSAPATAVAQELVNLCRAGRYKDAVNTLYSEKVVSIEPVGNETMPAEMRGIDSVRKKTDWWESNHEVHSQEVDGPFMGGEDEFAVHFSYVTTFKPTGERRTMNEMALYKLADGKVVKEQFFYNPGTP